MKVGVLCSRIRVEEKLLLAALRARGADVVRLDTREIVVDVNRPLLNEVEIVLVRCMSHSRAYYLTAWLANLGIPTVCSHDAIRVCGDKLLTSVALQEAGIPIPETRVAFTPDAALKAVETLGYPVVLKPLQGSWGRLLARISDRHAAEALLEHKSTLGGIPHNVFYIQQYLDKPGRDIRTLVVGERVLYAIYRHSDHWITNTALGGETRACPITAQIVELSLAAARAVKGIIVAVDLLETADGRLVVNEVNHTPEFRGALQATGIDIAGDIADYVFHFAKEGS